MFCPKCASQNTDQTKYCRGCGVDVSNVLTAIDGKPRRDLTLVEKQIDLFSSGLRGLVIGVGFLIVAGAALGISLRLAVLSVFLLAFSVFFVGTGVSRLVHSRALKRLLEPDDAATPPALAPGEAEFIKPARSIYETDDLKTPLSITEHTTTHLKMRSDDD